MKFQPDSLRTILGLITKVDKCPSPGQRKHLINFDVKHSIVSGFKCVLLIDHVFSQGDILPKRYKQNNKHTFSFLHSCGQS